MNNLSFTFTVTEQELRFIATKFLEYNDLGNYSLSQFGTTRSVVIEEIMDDPTFTQSILDYFEKNINMTNIWNNFSLEDIMEKIDTLNKYIDMEHNEVYES